MTHLLDKPAPQFPTVRDQDGADFDSSTVIGKEPCVLFFYPQAMTYGCTKEACSLRDVGNRPTFRNAADESKLMRIIGVSSDSVEKQKEFATKNDLNYTLLADTKKEVRKAYGVGGTALLGIAAQRVTFVIDRHGVVKGVENSSISMGAHTKLVEKWAAVFAAEQGSETKAMAQVDQA